MRGYSPLVIDADGAYSYVIPTDAARLVSTGYWLRGRVVAFLVFFWLLAALEIALGVLLNSGALIVMGVCAGAVMPVAMRLGVQRHRSAAAKRMGPQWRASFGRGGARVDLALSSTSYAWAHFDAWTVHNDELLLVHAGPPMGFVVVPISLVPEDEWQQLTTLLYEKLGPARKADTVRGGRLNRSTSRKLGEASTVHP